MKTDSLSFISPDAPGTVRRTDKKCVKPTACRNKVVQIATFDLNIFRCINIQGDGF